DDSLVLGRVNDRGLLFPRPSVDTRVGDQGEAGRLHRHETVPDQQVDEWCASDLTPVHAILDEPGGERGDLMTLLQDVRADFAGPGELDEPVTFAVVEG